MYVKELKRTNLKKNYFFIALLKGCISQSGVGGSHWSLGKPGNAKKTALMVAKAVGCNSEDILTCLQSKTVEEITKTQDKLRVCVTGHINRILIFVYLLFSNKNIM